MYQLVANQVFGIDGLVNLSNIMFLVAFSARDALKLRILSFFGEAVILPYYYFQNETLWAPLFWSVAFMAVNAVRIVATALERRPVVLNDKEEQLYRLAFTSIEKKEFLKLVSLARWVDCSPGDVILEKGRPVSDVSVFISGEIEALLPNETRMTFRPGQLIGDVSIYSGLVSPVDVVARGYGTVVKWDWRQLVEFMASRPALRAKLLMLVNTDLAAKLREISITVAGLVVEQSEAR
jgi:CRP-like cAMP-binding protein